MLYDHIIKILVTISILKISGIKESMEIIGVKDKSNPSLSIHPIRKIIIVNEGSRFPNGIGIIIKTHIISQLKNHKIFVDS